jgi:hypothetical protein
MDHSHRNMTIPLRVLAAAAALALPGLASAAGLPLILNAPAAAAAPAPKLAAQYELQLRLPEGRGLARLLLDAGVDRDDAAAAARLAAGHMGDGMGGCDAKVSISKAVGGNGFRLVRVSLLTAAGETDIERRGANLEIASQATARKSPRLV